MDTMIYQSGRDGRKEWNYLSFEGVILAPPKQFSSFAITTKRNDGRVRLLSGLIMISRIMVVWKEGRRREGTRKRMTLENRHDLLCPLTRPRFPRAYATPQISLGYVDRWRHQIHQPSIRAQILILIDNSARLPN